MLVSFRDLAGLDLTVPWVLEPYLPAEGIVLLYGKKGVGKSPITWSLTQSVASGEPWFGFAVQRPGAVLYVEVDTPPAGVRIRAPYIVTAPNAYLYAPTNPLVCQTPLEREARAIEPVLVILNTLRKIHPWDDKVSETPQRVYGVLRQLWPSACLLCVHHEKKDPTDHPYAEGEEYSGSLAWHNDAQVALRLSIPRGHPLRDGQALELGMTGNQMAAKAEPLRLILGQDGYTLTTRAGR